MGDRADINSAAHTEENGEHGTEVQVDLGGGDTATAEQYGPVGDDACPIPGRDTALTQEGSGSGEQQVIGYQDPQNPRKTLHGERRIYARDADTGEVVVEFWLKNDGRLVIEAKGDVEIKAEGKVKILAAETLVGADGREVACVGDFVQVVVPQLTNGSGPCTPLNNPTAVTSKLDYIAAGQIISGRRNFRAGGG